MISFAMSEKSKFRENLEAIWENRRKLAVLTVFGIAAIIYFGRNKGDSTVTPNEFFDDSNLPQTAESLPSGSSQSQPGQPDFVDLGPSGIHGIINGMVYGVPVHCATVNFRHSYFSDGTTDDPKYEPDQPLITYAPDALDVLQVPYASISDTNPLYVARGVNVVKVVSMQDHTLNMLGIDTNICTEVNGIIYQP